MARAMKNSGIEWIGEIPEEWNIKYASQVFSPVKCKNEGLTETNLLSLSYGTIKRKSIETTEGLLPENFDGYNIIEKDDIVLRLTDLQNDHKSFRVGRSNERGIITSAYLTLRPFSKNVPQFLFYFLHSFDICKGLYGMGSGVRQGLNWEDIRKLQILIPSITEQTRIAAFLDRKCAEIDSVITETKKTVEEYRKLKQSIITEAVTKGVRGERPTKPSGIEWIGEIPEEWETGKVSYFYEIALGKMIQPEQKTDLDTFENYLCAANLGGNRLKLNEIKQMWFSPEEKKALSITQGDLLVVEGGDVASCDIATKEAEGLFFQNALHRVRAIGENENRFLKYFLWMTKAIGQIDLICNKATIAHFSKEKFLALPFVVVPIDEQKEIADYLDTKCAEIDRLIAAKQQLLAELESYKKSVIYEYVTGKREVGVCL